MKNSLKFDKISRRMFVQGAGKTALAIPFLPSLLPEKAQAAVAAKPKFIQVQSDYFIARELATPGYYNSSIPWMQGDADTKYQMLSDVVARDGKVSQIFDNAWTPYINKMNIISNTHAYVQTFLHNTTVASTAGGGTGGDFSGPRFAYSTDYLLEKNIYRISGTTPSMGAIRFNYWSNESNQYWYSWGFEGGKVKELANTRNLTQLQSSLPSTNSSVDAKQVTRRKLIDAVLPELNRLKANPRLSGLDKQRLNEAADRWNDIQNRDPVIRACNIGAKSEGGDWDLNHKQAMEIVVAAMACGMTQVASYVLQQGGKDNPKGLHNYAHDARNRNFNVSQNWRARRVLDMIAMLNGTLDENGNPLLDSTVLQWMHEFSTWGHSKLGYVVLVAGGGNGKFRTGMHLDVNGAPINSVHITNMLASGLTMADIEKDGRTGFGEYSSSVLYQDGRADQVDDFTEYGETDVDYWNKQYGVINRSYRPTADFKKWFTDAAKRKPMFYYKG